MAAPMDELGKCSLHSYFEGDCGLSSKFPNEICLKLIVNCNKSIVGHLRACNMGEKSVKSEGELLCLRAGIWKWRPETDHGISVCPAHRYQYGIGWRPKVRCGFFRHPTTSNSKAQRGMSAAMCEAAQLSWGTLCRVGTGICRQCISETSELPNACSVKIESNKDTTEEKNQDKRNTTQPVMTHDKIEADQDDICEIADHNKYRLRPKQIEKENIKILHEVLPSNTEDYDSFTNSQYSQTTNSQTSNWSDCSELALEKVNMVMESINVSPLRSTLQKEITDVKDSTIRYYKRKAHESIDSLLDFMAPKQGHLLKDEVLTKNRDTSLPTESVMIEDLSKLYIETMDNSLKMQILSVITNRLTKAELQTAIPGLTIYRIDQARLHFNTSTNLGLQVKNKIKVPRQRMDDSKLEHAISFFFDTSFMQLVSYGTRDLKMDSGENITIPDVIRTTNHSKIIDLYFSYCTESNFEPLSKSTLFKILNTCAATKRTNLHGLDNIAAEGIEGFESLKEITKQIYERSILSTEEHEQIQKNITSAKLYFKTDYKLHLEKDCLCADHCLQWLLSDPENRQFQSPCEHIHTLVCDRCEMLHGIEDDVFKCIGKMGDDDFKEDTTKNFQDALQKINDWKAHIARNVNQDLFRTQKLDNLKRFEGVLVMDWAMKFLPMRYREKQTDWFGQRGKHWHVSVCIYRDENGEIGHRTFTHVLENVKQDWFAVASLLEHVLQTVKIQLPQVTDMFLRSDNAGCYHCGHLWIAIPQISNRTGIQIKQYSYSEAQAGKSYCDSKIAHMRTKMRSFVATGNNILNADDMKTAIDYGKGVAGCQVAHVIVETSKHVLKTHNLKNITHYNDVQYTESGVVFRKAYGIGDGLSMTYSELTKLSGHCQNETGCTLVTDFVLPSKVKGKIKLTKAESNAVENEMSTETTTIRPVSSSALQTPLSFDCPEPGCIKHYASYRTLENHVLLGTHDLRLERESVYDIIRKQWAELCNNVIVTRKKNVASQCTDNQQAVETLPMGWALKRARKVNRFPTKIKNFLIKKFNEGEKSKNKCSPDDVALEMKSMRDTEGRRVFQLNECLNSTQITSFFSRLVSANASNNKKIVPEDDDLVAAAVAINQSELIESVNSANPTNDC